MSRGWGALQNQILEACWIAADADPEATWITLDEFVGPLDSFPSRRAWRSRRESCARAIRRLAAAGELELGWKAYTKDWSERRVFLADELPRPSYSYDRLLSCRVPPAKLNRQHLDG